MKRLVSYAQAKPIEAHTVIGTNPYRLSHCRRNHWSLVDIKRSTTNTTQRKLHLPRTIKTHLHPHYPISQPSDRLQYEMVTVDWLPTAAVMMMDSTRCHKIPSALYLDRQEWRFRCSFKGDDNLLGSLPFAQLKVPQPLMCM